MGPVALQVIGSIEPVDYQEAWDRQREWHAQVVEGTLPDRLWLLEHPPVYTAGRRTEPLDRPFDGTSVIDVDRGGKITWHGPGQLWATRSSGCLTRSMWLPTSVGWRRC